MFNLLFKSSLIFFLPPKKVVPYGLETLGASLFVTKRNFSLPPRTPPQLLGRTSRSTLVKYQLEHRKKLGKINDTRIYEEKSFTEEKPQDNQDKIHYVINLYNYIDFHCSPNKKAKNNTRENINPNNQVFTTIQRWL